MVLLGHNLDEIHILYDTVPVYITEEGFHRVPLILFSYLLRTEKCKQGKSENHVIFYCSRIRGTRAV